LGPGVVQRGPPRVALGLVGVGRWGKRILATLEGLPDVELIALCSRGTARTAGAKPERFDRWQDLISARACAGLIVATPPDVHVPIALKALEAGMAVMIEKPLALSLREASRLQERVKAREGCPAVVVDHVHLFAPAYERLKSLIRSPIVAIRTRGCSSEPWRPYSSLFDFAPHDLSMVLDLLGVLPDDTTSRVVFEMTNETIDGPKLHQLFEIEMTFGSARVSCLVGNASSTKERYLEVSCENGDRLVYDDMQSVHKLTLNEKPIVVDAEKPLKNALAVFAAAVRGELDPRCGLDLAMKVQTVLERCATRSSSSGPVA
jgi:predicted dehydrogenase